MSKAEDLREAFLAEFGEGAARTTRTGKLLGFDQSESEPDTSADDEGTAEDT